MPLRAAGTYKAEVYSPNSNSYISDSSVSMSITVEETFDNDHRIVSQRGADSGRFTFSAADSGQHKLCFTPDSQGPGSWLSGAAGPVKMTVDIAIGETSKIESEDKGKMDDMATRVKNLNSRLRDIRREQIFQRVRTPPYPQLKRRYGNLHFQLLVPIFGTRGTQANDLPFLNRNANPNSVTSPRSPIPVLFVGL